VKPLKNVAASVHQRLLNLARQSRAAIQQAGTILRAGEVALRTESIRLCLQRGDKREGIGQSQGTVDFDGCLYLGRDSLEPLHDAGCLLRPIRDGP
jgi:hypothetical protein